MQRTNIYLEARQTAALDRVAQREGVTRAEVVRRLLDRGLAAETDHQERDLAVIAGTFGALPLAPGDEEASAVRGRSDRDAHLDRVWHG